MILILQKPATEEDIQKASEEYKTYVKVTLDVEKEIIAIGGEYHYDAEQKLLRLGCNQESIWGGGIDLVAKRIDVNAIINIRPKYNYSTEICDTEIRDKFTRLVKKYLPGYADK